MNRPAIGAALLTVAAAGSILLVGWEGAAPAPAATTGRICGAVTDLRDALDLSSLGDQAVLRSRAAHLADMLASPSPRDRPDGSVAVARQIVAVLDDPGATVADLAAAIEPIARECRD